MKPPARSSAAGLLLPAALTLASLAACSKCGTREPTPPAAPSGPTGPAAAAPVRAPLPVTTPAAGPELVGMVLPPAPPATAPAAAAPPHAASGTAADHGKAAEGGAAVPATESVVNPEGTAGALVVRTGDEVRVHLKGSVSAPFENVSAVTLSPDGKRAAWVAGVKGKRSLVLDGKVGPPFDAIEGLVFTRDSKHLFFKARTGEAWQVGCGAALGPKRTRISGELTPMKDRPVILAVERADKESPWQLVSYDASLRRKLVKEVVAAELMLNEDASVAAALVVMSRRKSILTFPTAAPEKATPGPWFDEITMVSFDRSGKHLAYGALRADQAFLVMDGKEEPLPTKTLLEVPIPNPAGGTAAVLLSSEMAWFHLGFAPGRPPEKKYHSVREPTFSPDGKHYAYVGDGPEGSVVVVDGVEGPGYDIAVLPTFSPDSRFLVYRAQRGAERFMVVADATGKVLRRHPAYDEVFPPTFTADGSIAYAVKDGPRLRWLTEKL